jgi:hypothetical protein
VTGATNATNNTLANKSLERAFIDITFLRAGRPARNHKPDEPEPPVGDATAPAFLEADSSFASDAGLT